MIRLDHKTAGGEIYSKGYVRENGLGPSEKHDGAKSRVSVDSLPGEKELRLYNLADSLPTAMLYQLTVLPDGGRQFTYVSRGVEWLHELTSAQVLNDAEVLYGQMLPEYRLMLRECEDKALVNMSTIRVHVQNRLPSGQLRWFTHVCTPLRLADGRLVWDGVEVDITEHKQTAENLEQRVAERTAALREANRFLRSEIEEHKRAEKELRNIQKRYQAVVEEQTEVICRLDPEGRFLFVNDTFCTFLGRSKEELLGTLWAPQAHSDDVERVQTQLSLISTRNPIVAIENRIVDARGAERWMQFVNRGFFDSTGNLAEIQCVGRDITDRKEVEARLQESEARFKALFYQAVDGIVFMPIEGTTLVVNDAFAKMHGYDSPREMEHLRLTDLDTPESARLAPERLRRLKSGEAMNFEVEHYRKDGSTFPLEVSCQVIESNGKRFYLGFHHDITERKETEKALRESEERYRVLIEDSIVGIGISKGNKILFANKALLDLFGYDSVDEVPPGGLLALMAPEFKEAVRERIERREAGNPISSSYELRIVRKDGATRDVQLQAAYVNVGNERLTQTTFRDVTELKKTEEEGKRFEIRVQQAQKLESLGILAGGIAHDFNNILQIILANLNMMQKVVPETNVARSLFERMEESIDRAKDLTRQMLAYAGKSSFNIHILDSGNAVQEIVQFIKPLISKKIVLKTEIEKDLPSIEADTAQLHQVVMNLVLNAAEASDDDRGGVVTVSVTARHCTEAYLHESRMMPGAPEGEYICIEITDTGCGMDRDTLEKIFDPFFSTKFAGRGLGMSAVLGIMRAHKGAVLVDSVPGGGTAVRVFFPVAGNPVLDSAKKERDITPSPQTGRGTLLFADDEPDMAELAQLMLQDMGYTVFIAGNGLEALDMFKSHSDEITCVVLDLSMPQLDGLQTLVEMRRIKPGLKAVLMSGYAEQEIESRVAGEPIDAFLGKPFDIHALSDILRKLLG